MTYQSAHSQSSAFVDYDAFLKLAQEVKPHRAERIITLAKFKEMSKKDDVIILDTRSKAMYDAKHIKGAIHLNFADFTQKRLKEVIPSVDTKILIYCNNNFEDDAKFFPTKMYIPPSTLDKEDRITLALNIPTYINLYGYGYKNVYELGDLISAFGKDIELEGTSIK